MITGGTVVDQSGSRRADVRDRRRRGRRGRRLACSRAHDDDRTRRHRAASSRPGFVDLHAHLREPGKEEAETIETGSRAAALGGFTCVVAMPNTDPTQDSVSVVEFVRRQGELAGLCDVRPSGSITIGRRGEQLSPLAELAAAGVHLFTDDGTGVQDPLLMRRALEYALDLGVVLAQHCEVARLTDGAVMHEGDCCSRLGLPGWPSIAEELMVHRDIELARLTGGQVHLLHLSTAGSVELVRRAKADGLRVSAEATPHHISLTDELLAGYDSRLQGQPAAAHAGRHRRPSARASPTGRSTPSPPITRRTRRRPRSSRSTRRRPGCSGSRPRSASAWRISTCRSRDIVAALSWKPAAIAGVADQHGRPVMAGEPANLVVFDPDATWQVQPARLASKSRNTPVRRRRAARPGAPHAAARRTGRARREGDAMRSSD